MTADSHVDRFITTLTDVHDPDRVDFSPKTITELFAVLGLTSAPWPKQKAVTEQWLTVNNDHELHIAWENFKELVSQRP